jgi:hypothetical protein
VIDRGCVHPVANLQRVWAWRFQASYDLANRKKGGVVSTANNTAHGRLTTTEGVVSVSVGGNAYMDAAVLDGIAGIELSVEEARVTIGPRPDDRRADLTLCLDMDRHTMERLFYLLAAKLELPAFNETEWKLLANGALTLAESALTMSDAELIQGLAERIEKAYEANER